MLNSRRAFFFGGPGPLHVLVELRVHGLRAQIRRGLSEAEGPREEAEGGGRRGPRASARKLSIKSSHSFFEM